MVVYDDDSAAYRNADTLGGKHKDPLVVGPCRIEARLAVGQTSRLYRAVDTDLQRTVALKLVSSPHDEDGAFVERFLSCARALIAADAPHLVQVLHAGTLDARAPYAVFEFLDGHDLDRVLQRERVLTPAAAMRAVLDAASGLRSAHELGVAHGDVRPRHLIRTGGTTKVTGFGLSPPRQTAQRRALTGHPAYIAPEVASGHASDHLSDIYSLGCTLYELTIGRRPFGTAGADALIACHLHEPFPSMRAIDDRVPAELDDLLFRMVQKPREKRFASYLDLLAAGAKLLPALRRLRPDDPSLVVEDGRQRGLRITIAEGDTLLGRVPGEGLEIDDARVSRRHAVVRRAGEYVEIVDLDSRNGIRINGSDVKSRQLFPGDHIEVGDTLLRVDGPVAAVQQMPVVGLPNSPVRGAFGDVEVIHAPAHQSTLDTLGNAQLPGAAQRLAMLGALAPLMAQRRERVIDLASEFMPLLGELVAADERAFVRIENGQTVFDARTGQQAQVLSCILPALGRALPGRLALTTSVRVGTDDRWNLLLAPLFEGEQLIAYLAFTKVSAPFSPTSLTLVEHACAFLRLRSAPGA